MRGQKREFDAVIAARLSLEEKQLIEKFCKATNKFSSDFVRDAILIRLAKLGLLNDERSKIVLNFDKSSEGINKIKMVRIAESKYYGTGHNNVTYIPEAVKLSLNLESNDFLEWFIKEGDCIVRKKF